MVKLFNFIKPRGKRFHFSELGAELLEKNKALEDINKSGGQFESLQREKEAQIKRKERILEEKAFLLSTIEEALKNKELDLTSRLIEIEESTSKKQMFYALKLKSLIQMKMKLEQEWAAKEKQLSGKESDLEAHKEAIQLIGAAHKHLELENLDDAKDAYEGIRHTYRKLSPDARKKIHSDIMRLKEGIAGKLHRQISRQVNSK